MENKMMFMCVQPCTKYYAWQIEVMLTNFKEVGISDNFQVQCLFAYNSKREADWEQKVNLIKKVEEKMRGVAEFFYYEDTRVYPFSYTSSIRPNVLKQHFKAYEKDLLNRVIFYHDCDIVFTKYPDFLSRINVDDNTWYVSDTKSYIGHEYIISKGQDVLDKMCEIVGINQTLVKEKQLESGGAQYVMKGVDWRFFEKMEKDSERLFKEITELNKTKKATDPSHHEIQIWCADMWAILWQAWMRGYTTRIIKEMEFCWATDTATRWNDVYIFHNAGVTKESSQRLFFKGDFSERYPYLERGETYDKTTASYKYFSIIQEIGKSSCLYSEQATEALMPTEPVIIEPQVVEIVETLPVALTPESVDEDFLSLNVIKRAHGRFSICKGCTDPSNGSANLVTTAKGTKLCRLCGCQTEKKIVAPEIDGCPLGKWII